MGKSLIKIAIVLLTFVASIFITEKVINKDMMDMTKEMSIATLPVVSTEYNGIEINRMYGYLSDMDINYMRENITPLMSGRRLRLWIDKYGLSIHKMAFEVRAIDDNRLIEDTEITEFDLVGRKVKADVILKDLIESNQEYEFILKLTMGDGREVKYYTRVMNPEEYYISDKLEYVSDFTDSTFDKDIAEGLKTYLEPNSSADNTTFGYVNIHSKFDQITWGDLHPVRVTEPIITIKELAPLTGSFITDFYISVRDEELEKERYYKVQEFFRVRYSKTRMYLLDYERTMNEVFVDEKDSYSENAIVLGITDGTVNMVESEDGSNVAFETGGRLYVYNVPDNRIAYLFGYFDNYTDDERQLNDRHHIKIMNVDEAGNVSFLVYGYFNRGDHEGNVGMSAFYYDASVNTIEELAYIPSRHAPDLLMKEVEQLSFMNSKGELYLLIGSRLYDVHSDSRLVEVIAEDLTVDSYVISSNNHMVAWQKGSDNNNCQTLCLMNLETGAIKEIAVRPSETVMPISFMGEDLIYGIVRKSDITKDRAGTILLPMYMVKIENISEGLLMTYSQEDTYVISGEVNGNQITLHRMHKEGDGPFTEYTDDQIMNAEDVEASKNTVGNYIVEPYEKITDIEFAKAVNASSMKHLSPKMVLYEGSREIELDNDRADKVFVVYGKYGVDSFFTDPAMAVQKAYDISGIVMNEEGEYIYKKTSRSAKNQIMAIQPDGINERKGSLAVCLDTMIGYEGVIRNSQYMLDQGQSPMEILNDALPDNEIMDLSGCTLDMIMYYVNLDIPVLAILEDGSAVLIIGFNDTEVVIMNPQKAEIYKVPTEDLTETLEENGNYFITYLSKK